MWHHLRTAQKALKIDDFLKLFFKNFVTLLPNFPSLINNKKPCMNFMQFHIYLMINSNSVEIFVTWKFSVTFDCTVWHSLLLFKQKNSIYMHTHLTLLIPCDCRRHIRLNKYTRIYRTKCAFNIVTSTHVKP